MWSSDKVEKDKGWSLTGNRFGNTKGLRFRLGHLEIQSVFMCFVATTRRTFEMSMEKRLKNHFGYPSWQFKLLACDPMSTFSRYSERCVRFWLFQMLTYSVELCRARNNLFSNPGIGASIVSRTGIWGMHSKCAIYLPIQIWGMIQSNVKHLQFLRFNWERFNHVLTCITRCLLYLPWNQWDFKARVLCVYWGASPF